MLDIKQAELILDDITNYYNTVKSDGTYYTATETTKKFNISYSTFIKLKYRHPDKFLSHKNNKHYTKQIFELLTKEQRNNIYTDYCAMENNKRVFSNEFICKHYNISVFTLYKLVKILKKEKKS